MSVCPSNGVVFCSSILPEGPTDMAGQPPGLPQQPPGIVCHWRDVEPWRGADWKLSTSAVCCIELFSVHLVTKAVPRACAILGVIFLVSTLCIYGKAIHDLATKLLPEVDDFLFSVSIISGVLCSILAVVKFMLGRILTSKALITDGFNSLVGGIMAFSILISAEVYNHNPGVWYLDGSIGILIGMIILAYGIKLLIDTVPRIKQTHNYESFE
ncbi:transmembrane protein 163a [Rhincodon typus]|uniref:transmembrane protein 163a n=1 Tax=Rhincodon typus TaxID=259920 RepID=UPI00202E42AA|nr:transmembrane protein 163a [Rhincodon typus]